MAEAIRAFVVLDSGVSQADIERALPRGTDVEVVGMVHGIDDAWVRLHETTNDLLVIACAGQSEQALDADRQRSQGAAAAAGGRLRVRLAERLHEPCVRRRRRRRDRAPDDARRGPLRAPEGDRAQGRTAEAGSFSRAPLVCVLGPKGGTGKTLTSTSLAVALAEAGKSVALVDLDLQFGDVGLCLGLTPETTIFDLVRTGGSLDEEKLEGFMLTHSTGVKVLLAPSRPDHAAVVSVEFLREVYATLRQMFDYVVVDTPPGFTPEVIATIDNATASAWSGCSTRCRSRTRSSASRRSS